MHGDAAESQTRSADRGVNEPDVEHVPVLSDPLAEQISLPQDGVMVDATVGHGGHSFLFGRTLGPGGTLVGLDVDSHSLHRARQRLAGLACKVILIKSNFARMAERLGEWTSCWPTWGFVRHSLRIRTWG